ncbi:unnamed protein product [Ambrosiozyma monospora]|uniref:Unnamed protein product n=1 Tax=Ambrosiozyma monospora TaxID=43982 RepID=A0ACB5U2T2_AMBMO|nr:unnamed protein product [Ambrosiozyma monospora]
MANQQMIQPTTSIRKSGLDLHLTTLDYRNKTISLLIRSTSNASANIDKLIDLLNMKRDGCISQSCSEGSDLVALADAADEIDELQMEIQQEMMEMELMTNATSTAPPSLKNRMSSMSMRSLNLSKKSSMLSLNLSKKSSMLSLAGGNGNGAGSSLSLAGNAGNGGAQRKPSNLSLNKKHSSLSLSQKPSILNLSKKSSIMSLRQRQSNMSLDNIAGSPSIPYSVSTATAGSASCSALGISNGLGSSATLSKKRSNLTINTALAQQEYNKLSMNVKAPSIYSLNTGTNSAFQLKSPTSATLSFPKPISAKNTAYSSSAFSSTTTLNNMNSNSTSTTDLSTVGAATTFTLSNANIENKHKSKLMQDVDSKLIFQSLANVLPPTTPTAISVTTA